MATMMLGVKQFPEKEKETVIPDGIFLRGRTLSLVFLQPSPNISLSRATSSTLPEPEYQWDGLILDNADSLLKLRSASLWYMTTRKTEAYL